MHTTLFLVRNAATDWGREERIAGRREIALSTEGRDQAGDLGKRMAGIELAEVLSSPLPRAVQTAEAIAGAHELEVARDPRLTDFDAGRWEGKKFGDVAATDEYKRFVASPMTEVIPGGERMAAVRDRMIGSVEQALQDNEMGANIVLVSHAGPLRVLVSHYLGMDLVNYHRLRLSPASVTVLRFDSVQAIPRLLAVNALGDLAPSIR